MSVNSGGYLPRRSGSVNIHGYSPPVRRIIVEYLDWIKILQSQNSFRSPSSNATSFILYLTFFPERTTQFHQRWPKCRTWRWRTWKTWRTRSGTSWDGPSWHSCTSWTRGRLAWGNFYWGAQPGVQCRWGKKRKGSMSAHLFRIEHWVQYFFRRTENDNCTNWRIEPAHNRISNLHSATVALYRSPHYSYNAWHFSWKDDTFPSEMTQVPQLSLTNLTNGLKSSNWTWLLPPTSCKKLPGKFLLRSPTRGPVQVRQKDKAQ